MTVAAMKATTEIASDKEQCTKTKAQKAGFPALHLLLRRHALTLYYTYSNLGARKHRKPPF